MKILITGALPDSLWDMVTRFKKTLISVTVAGESSVKKPSELDAPFFNITPDQPEFKSVFSSRQFDAVLFFFSVQSDDIREQAPALGRRFDELVLVTALCERAHINKFVLVTDQHVFGSWQNMTEDEKPEPDSIEGSLIRMAEEYTLSQSAMMKILIVRVTNLYAPGAKDTFFEQIASAGGKVLLNGSEQTPCDFVHADDFASLIANALIDNADGIIHAAYGSKITYSDTVLWLREQIPNLNVLYTGKISRTRTLKTGRAYKQLSWVPRHSFMDEVFIEGTKQKKFIGPRAVLIKIKNSLGKLLPWVEMLVGAVIMQMLVKQTQTYAYFRVVDVRILFTILMGSVHGTLIGVAAGIAACISFIMGWVSEGNDPLSLFYNMNNWLPFVMYLMAGSVTGYLHERNMLQHNFLKIEKEKTEASYDFLKQIYSDTCETRNDLLEQVIRSRDSYGRISKIVEELDKLNRDEIFVSALSVLEDIMQNNHIAIYTRTEKVPYARLTVQSSSLQNKLEHSLNLEKLPELLKEVKEARLFSNTKLLPGYPSFCATLRITALESVLIMLWEEGVNQLRLHYKNLFFIVTGFIRASLVRAARFEEEGKDRCICGTHILKSDTFLETLVIRQKMQEKHISQFLLLQIGDELSDEELNQRVGSNIRKADVVGKLADGKRCIILTQAKTEHLPIVINRLQKAGIHSQFNEAR